MKPSIENNEVKNEQPKLSPAEYNELLEGVQLRQIILTECKSKLFDTQLTKPATVHVETKSHFLPMEDNHFVIADRYKIVSKVGRKRLFSIEVEYHLLFESAHTVGEDFFEIYAELNLPLNTYPYVREIVQSLTSRMGLPQLVLPLVKQSP